MHLFDAPQVLRNSLANSGLPRIFARVILRVWAFFSNNQLSPFSTFGTGEFLTEIDITGGVTNNRIIIKNEGQIFPTGDGKLNSQGQVKIQVANPWNWLASAQNGAMIVMDRYTEGQLEISANISDGLTQFDVYKGGLIDAPIEEHASTTFVARSGMWEILNADLVSDQLADNIPGSWNPRAGYNNSTFTIVSFPYNFAGDEYFEGTIIHDQFGIEKITFELESFLDIPIHDFRGKVQGDTPLLGQYVIRFTETNGAFDLINPDGTIESSTVGTPSGHELDGKWVSIVQQEITGSNPDVVGAEIRIQLYYTAVGNPFRIAKNLLDKAITGRWGLSPQFTSDLVDWGEFDRFEQNIIPPATMFFSETNKDNEVYDETSDSKPLKVRQAVQKILEHVGCSLYLTNEGKISIETSLFTLPGDTIHPYTSASILKRSGRSGGGRTLYGEKRNDRLVIQYAYQAFLENYYAEIEFKEPSPISGNKYETYYLQLQYWKTFANFGNAALNFFLARFWEKLRLQHLRMDMELLPQFGLTVEVGDVFRADFDEPPVLPNPKQGLGEYWQIYSVSKEVGGSAKVKARQIPEPERLT